MLPIDLWEVENRSDLPLLISRNGNTFIIDVSPEVKSVIEAAREWVAAWDATFPPPAGIWAENWDEVMENRPERARLALRSAVKALDAKTGSTP